MHPALIGGSSDEPGHRLTVRTSLCQRQKPGLMGRSKSVAPGDVQSDPMGHRTHSTDPRVLLSRKWPTLHKQSEMASEPSPDAENNGQSKHSGLPNSSLYVFRGQSLSSPLVQKVPGGHGWQTPTRAPTAVSSKRCPSGHGAGGGVGGKIPSE